MRVVSSLVVLLSNYILLSQKLIFSQVCLIIYQTFGKETIKLGIIFYLIIHLYYHLLKLKLWNLCFFTTIQVKTIELLNSLEFLLLRAVFPLKVVDLILVFEN